MPINWTNATTTAGMMQIANQNSGGWFWTAMLFMVYVVMIISLIGFGIEVALLSANFLAILVSILMVYMGLVSWTIVAFFIGFQSFLFLYIMWSSRQ